jgi:uncharacterized protein
MAETLSEELLAVLCCPVCKGDLKYTSKKDGLHCTKCKHTYEIKEGIPVLLPAE